MLNQDQIIIFDSLIFLAVTSYAQQTITGIVRDSKGSPVAQANVIITETRSYAITNEQGAFTLSFSEKLPGSVRNIAR